MNFVRLILDIDYGNYSYNGASNTEMGNLGLFFTDDVGCSGGDSFKDFVLNDKFLCASSNATYLEKEDDYILLSSLHAEDLYNPVELRITRDQFLKLINDWNEKVCKVKPKEVIIKYENGEFIFETKN
ncbi:MAG TPA: hypothetical protein PLU71_01570 [Candidatus Dependentiae bacterium]|nr:hypothetical protein [Candidatus Dependentiae bacterium]HRQ62521.1 hypothetical protein [Candidatus Dependentiae bacterium]